MQAELDAKQPHQPDLPVHMLTSLCNIHLPDSLVLSDAAHKLVTCKRDLDAGVT